VKNILKGKLTYVSGALIVLGGIAGLALNFLMPENALAMPHEQAFKVILEGLAILGLRRAIN